MAVLSKIRQRSFLVIAIVGLALFAFVLTGLFDKGGASRMSQNVGTVNGEDISTEDFRIKVDAAEKNSQGMSMIQAVNGVWDQEVKRVLLEGEYEKLGLRIGRDQLIEVIKNNPNFSQDPRFLNDAKQFDKAKFNEFVAGIKSNNPEQWQSWLAFEKQIEEMAREQMYSTLIKGGLNATNVEGKLSYEMENNKVAFDYVDVSYASINDDQVKISDNEIIDYMRKNEKKYKADASRDLEFILIDDKPSDEDQKEVKDLVNSLLTRRVVYNEATAKNDTLPGFAAATNVADFVNANSDIPYDTTYVTRKDLPAEHADKLFNLAAGELYGPYMIGDYYCVSKLVDRKAGASAKASHILISFAGSKAPNPAITRTKEEAKAKAEDLLKQIQANPASFEALVPTNSDDPGSAQNRGEYDNIKPNQMVKPFNDFIFNNPVGKLGIVETDFGYHIIKVTGKEDAVRLATIAQKIEASEATSDQIYTKASKAEQEAATAPLEKVGKELNVPVTPVNGLLAFDENVQGLGSQRGIVQWAFNKDTKEGDVKKFDIPAGHVIAKLKKINEEGLQSVTSARVALEPILKNKKKAELIKAKMKGATLEEVAKNNSKTVQPAIGITVANPMIPNVGMEPKVVGTAFATADGKTSGLIEGKSGVFMVRTKSVVKAPALPNYGSYTNRIRTEVQAAAPQRALMSLKSNAKIKDHRAEIGY